MLRSRVLAEAVTTGYTCGRCGTRWGLLTILRWDPRRELMRACLEGRCDIRQMLLYSLKRWADRYLTVV